MPGADREVGSVCMSERKVFPDSVIPLPNQPGLSGNGLIVNSAALEHKDEEMTVLFSLSLPGDAQRALEERVARGEVVPPDELASKYGANQADLTRLEAWLKDHGF